MLGMDEQVYRALIQACGDDMGVDKVWQMMKLLSPREKNNFVYSAAIKSCDKVRLLD